jgi:hypothetical protein
MIFHFFIIIKNKGNIFVHVMDKHEKKKSLVVIFL